MKHFKSSWDSTLKFHSALLSLILLISVGTLVNRQSYIMAGLILLIPLAAKIFSVSEYTTDEADLKIRRPIGSVTIPLSKISLARRLSEEELSSTIRLFGIGGLFGHWGYFYSSKLGRLRIYSTKSRAVWVFLPLRAAGLRGII